MVEILVSAIWWTNYVIETLLNSHSRLSLIHQCGLLWLTYILKKKKYSWCIKIFIKLTVHSCTKQHVHYMNVSSCARVLRGRQKSTIWWESRVHINKATRGQKQNYRTHLSKQNLKKWSDVVKLKSYTILLYNILSPNAEPE